MNRLLHSWTIVLLLALGVLTIIPKVPFLRKHILGEK